VPKGPKKGLTHSWKRENPNLTNSPDIVGSVGGWGRIVNITSVAGVLGGYAQTSYAAAKAGLIALAKSIALEGARSNITANCVLVGLSATDASSLLKKEALEKVEKRTAIGRSADP
jgi:3-oxoacyl-[acyl-carrier protein] reductase